ncbi:IclR family transcriptional regulator [Sphingobacterium bovistauri]|uniref:IclR family transcriptional regulator n=1 Tax=Sphingobacterium bovistauri TaxID=2781959 RepID=A0ABS7Z3G4_9SPHI|nr:IclR family transcriptional regulator [Sphingobacterium bovistauri]MCA5004726.1 IclR family transcriptional regulator [Sphingobacterium bovistauri]
MDNNKYKAPALEKGLDIIEFLAKQPAAQSQSEIAIGLNKSPNEIYRMLSALESRGYVHRDGISSKYSLTLKLYYLSHHQSFIEKLRSAALQPMKQTSLIVKEPCHLGVLFNDKVLVIAYSKSPFPISVMIEEGNLYDIFNTASGKILLSSLDKETRNQILDKDESYLNLSVSEKEKFQTNLDIIKNQGYIEMSSTYAQGVIDFSVPIGNSSSGIMACLTISKLLTIKNNEQLQNDEIIATLLACKKDIEGNLGLY